jgi:lipoprotein-releasing system permease protein
MLKNELFISWRYLFTKRKEKFISAIGLISVLGVAIGVMALIVVIGVMTGFDKDLRDKIIGNYSHITIGSYRGLAASEYAQMEKKILASPHVIAVSPYVQGQVLTKEGQRFFAVSLKGIDPQKEGSVTKIKQYLKEGAIDGLGADSVIIGKELASYLGLGLGAALETYSPSGKKKALKVSGIFASGMFDYDLNLIFTSIPTAQEILGMNDQISALALKLDNLYLADTVKKELSHTLGFDYTYKTWMEANQNFFAALNLEKLTMFIILTLIILVASFNIISTLIVMAVEKTKDIGILKALGMSSASVRKIFTLIGLTIGTCGITLGVSGGLLLCGLLKKYQFIKLPKDIYYMDKLPVKIVFWPDVALIIIAALLITLAASVYPAGRAAQLKPVEALRYE